tara:strand:+ start:260 stop:397 length:138 start_codon:yes stop_codon:yes gene_type:complete
MAVHEQQLLKNHLQKNKRWLQFERDVKKVPDNQCVEYFFDDSMRT